jgi:hypothetical protein
MMAQGLGVTQAAIVRWRRRQAREIEPARSRGRPEVIPEAARTLIRACYEAHFGQWGPRILSEWCLRKDLGAWSPTTIDQIISDLKQVEPCAKPRRRYEVTRSGVMWSEDGAGFRQNGCKWELVIAQDEHSRYKVNHRLVSGPAAERDVVTYLEAAFERYGAPLVLKHDGGKIFHGRRVQALLRRCQVLDLTGPAYWPGYNGKKERSIRDIKSYERAMRRHGVGGTLADRLDAAIEDLNEDRPRPMLGGRTAREAFEAGRRPLPDRAELRKEVAQELRRLRSLATSRHQVQSARRRAIEVVLSKYGLLRETGDVSHDFSSERRTN